MIMDRSCRFYLSGNGSSETGFCGLRDYIDGYVCSYNRRVVLFVVVQQLQFPDCSELFV